ncbi:MAG: hypothetical protein EOO65_06175 [Methanosarcinales archaeon]|nr:MAG: hypothetical protein EOO65_06175 [Methanosarcinales archaeon]
MFVRSARATRSLCVVSGVLEEADMQAHSLSPPQLERRQCVQYLYTFVTTDAEKAKKLEDALPPGLHRIDFPKKKGE